MTLRDALTGRTVGLVYSCAAEAFYWAPKYEGHCDGVETGCSPCASQCYRCFKKTSEQKRRYDARELMAYDIERVEE